jgi:hypothetical protein
MDLILELDGKDLELLETTSVKYNFYNLGNISALISSTTTQMGLYFTGDDWLKDDITVMKTKNNFIYTQNKDAKLVSPNPT